MPDTAEISSENIICFLHVPKSKAYRYTYNMCVRPMNNPSGALFMSADFSSKTTRPRDVLFFLKDTLSIEDEKLFKACKSVCSSVC